MTPKVIPWDAAWGPWSEQAMQQRLMAEGYRVCQYHYPPGTYFPPHTHSVDKKDAVLRGRLKIAWEGGSVVLEPGDMIEIPAGFSHSAEVVGRDEIHQLSENRFAEMPRPHPPVVPGKDGHKCEPDSNRKRLFSLPSP